MVVSLTLSSLLSSTAYTRQSCSRNLVPKLFSALYTINNTMADAKSGTDAPKMAVATQGLPVDPFARFTPRSEQLTVQRLHYGDVKFDPKKHLSYVPPREILTMQDLGFPKDIGVSPVAVSQPFQLFSEEAIDAMRAEIFQKDVQENCTFSSNIAARQLRGYAKKYVVNC